MFNERLEDLSVYYWIKNQFLTIPGLNIVDAFPDSEIKFPTISVEWDDIIAEALELGGIDEIKQRKYYIDIFALTKTQRDELGYKLFNDLKNKIPIYNYNNGFPPIVTEQLYCFDVISKRLKNIKIIPELVQTMYYRANLTFSVIPTIP